MSISKDDLSILRRFRLPSTPDAKDITMQMRDLNRRGLLSIKPETRKLVRVQTTEAGMDAVRQAETGR